MGAPLNTGRIAEVLSIVSGPAAILAIKLCVFHELFDPPEVPLHNDLADMVLLVA
jgi:hypothetical protein